MMFWNRLLTLGSGVGIEVRGEDLAVALVKSQWKGVTVVGKTVLHDFRRRPAAEWGKEYEAFLKSHGFRDLPAMLVPPRAEVIVRLLSLPAMSRAELRSAVRFQLDGLHPYGEDGIYHSFTPLTSGAPGVHVAVVIAPRAVVDGYADRFAEAGVKLRGMTVAAAGYYGAARLMRRGVPEPFLLVDQHDSVFELYGEGKTRPFFSASFDAATMPLEKAVAAAAAELRLEEGESFPLLVCGERSAPSPLAAEQVLGSPLQAPAEFELARDATVFAAALAAACPRWGWGTNLLPADRRSSSARWPVAATAAASFAVAAIAVVLSLRGPVQDNRYARELNREVKRLEAVERETRALERQAEKARTRRAQLETFRRRAEADLVLLTELSRRLPQSVWLGTIEIGEDAVQMSGQADSAAPLLGLVDNSGILTGASFVGSIGREQNREIFRIRAARRAIPLPAAPGPAHTAAHVAPGHSGN